MMYSMVITDDEQDGLILKSHGLIHKHQLDTMTLQQQVNKSLTTALAIANFMGHK